MSPQELAQALRSGLIKPDQLPAMSHDLLYAARAHAPQDMQGLLASPEHQAFAREATRENPMMALPIAAGSLAYPLYKALFSPGRSEPSFDQVKSGLLGVGQGLGLLGR